MDNSHLHLNYQISNLTTHTIFFFFLISDFEKILCSSGEFGDNDLVQAFTNTEFIEALTMQRFSLREIDTVTLFQIPDEVVRILHSTNTLEKDITNYR